MKYKFLIAALLAATPSAALAELTAGYQEHFDNLNVSNAAFAPKFWGHHVTSGSMTYTNPAEGGQSGAYLAAGNQYTSFIGGIRPDYLVTPAVRGTVKFHARLTSASDGYVKLYKMTGQTGTNAYTFEESEYTIADMPVLSDGEWSEMTIADVPEGTRFGFLLNNAAIDEFSATEADLVATQALAINSAMLDGDFDNFAGPDGKVTINATLTLTNCGDVDLAAGADNYAISFYLGSYSALTEPAAATVPLTETLAAGASATISVSAALDVSACDPADNYYVWLKEGISNTSQKLKQSNGYSDVSGSFYPYKPIATFCRTDFDAAYKSAVQMQLLRNDAEATAATRVKIANTAGKAPLTITGVRLPDGFTCDLAVPVSVEALNSVTATISFTSQTPGDHSGDIVLETGELGDVSWPLKAYVIDSGKWICDFEGNASLPDGFISGGFWSVEQAETGLSPETDANCMVHTGSTETTVMTPLLIFAEGDELMFLAASHSGRSSRVTVSYSTDRNTWTELAAIAAPTSLAEQHLPNDFLSDEYGAAGLYNQYVAAMPAGRYYIAFTGKDVKIDDIAGGTLAAVDKDLYVTSATFPAEGVVNNRLSVTVSVRNLGNSLAADDYTAILYLGDEAVATAETYPLDKNDSESFTFTFTPHTAGVLPACVEFKAGDYTLSTQTTDIRITAESAEKTVQIGGTENYTSSSIPLSPSSYKENSTETVYPAEMLDGLVSGNELTSLTYYGYVKSYSGEPSSSLDIAVYAENTEDTAPGDNLRDTAEMTCLFDGTATLKTDAAQTEPYSTLTRIVFDTPFVYTGGNLRISIVTRQAESFVGNVYTTVNRDVSGTTIYSGYSSANKASQTPIARLGVATETAVLSGTVIDKSTRQPVEGATVTLTSDDGTDVIYTADADADGQYAINIIQGEKSYTITACAERYYPFTAASPISFADGSQTLDIELEPESSGIDTAVAPADSYEVATGAGNISVTSSTPVDIVIADISGRILFTASKFVGHKTIDGLARGIYFVGNRKVAVR